MNKLFTVFLLIAAELLFCLPLPDKVMAGYWHNWDNSPNSIMLNQISDDFDVIYIAFATPTQPLGSTMQFVPDPGIYPQQDTFISHVQALHEAGKNVIISIGGANDPITLENQDDISNFVTSMTTIINTYGFDGIDIDLEAGSVMLEPGDTDFTAPTTPRIINLIQALNQLTSSLPDLLLTTAPETAYVQGAYSAYGGIWGAYLPIIHALRDRWDIVQVQHYNTGSMFGADGSIYTPATADFHVAMADMLLGGFMVFGNTFFEPLAAHQVAIGLPASPQAAGSGYTSVENVHYAVDYLITGQDFGGTYQLSNPAGYHDFRGLMTWSVNWDADYDFQFSQGHRSFLDSYLNQIYYPPLNLSVNIHTGSVSWQEPAADVIEYNVFLDSTLISVTQQTNFQLIDLVICQNYQLGIQAVYESGSSEIVSQDFIYLGNHFYGDIDDNGLVEALDAALILQYVVAIDPAPHAPLPWQNWQLIIADPDGNGNIEAYDSALVMRYVVGIINGFPCY